MPLLWLQRHVAVTGQQELQVKDGQGMGSHAKAVTAFVILAMVAGLIATMNSPSRVTAQPAFESIGVRENRQQFGVTGAGSTIVWEDRLFPTSVSGGGYGGQADPSIGTSDLRGMDIHTGRVFDISLAEGDQAEPAISDDVVVWQDSQHSCPTCELDILGLDLRTGNTFTIADGPADQAHPAVSRSHVTWLQGDEQGLRVMAADLETLTPFPVAAVEKAFSAGRPVISDQYIVWSEIGSAQASRLVAYDLGTRQTTVVTSLMSPQASYAIEGSVVVWADPDVRVRDLATGIEDRIDTGRAANIAIAEKITTWAAPSIGADSGIDIYGLHVGDHDATPLIVMPGNQTHPTVVGNMLYWQDHQLAGSRIQAQPIQEAFATGAGMLTEQRQISAAAAAEEDFAPLYTRPTIKGMHVAIGAGWRVLYGGIPQPCNATACPAIDALKSGNAPMFGSFLILHTDLTTDTGRDSPLAGTNPAIADWLKYWQSTYSVRPVVRLWPNAEPGSSGGDTPEDVAQTIISLASTFDWIKHIQVDNEPNLAEGWGDVCKDGQPACTWVTNGVTRSYRWTGVYDYRKYQAINQFYVDAWYTTDYYRYNHPNATIRTRLQAMQLWTPPMADIYRLLDNGSNFYDHLQGLISLYGRMTYHTYPAPSYDADGSGGVVNNSWNWFNTWLQGRVNSSTVRTMITEFGWNPGQMARTDCFGASGLTQNSTWPSTGSVGCRAGDSVTHLFENDLSRFLAYHRHNTEAVTVWIVRGWNNRADGLDSAGLQKRWFQNYQTSSP
ncbi:MAG TPA: hypothetical protein PLR44_15010 [Thermomicrobiales bacterium]|nr:hypothetical protein [Thermomicrobiales bacterium]